MKVSAAIDGVECEPGSDMLEATRRLGHLMTLTARMEAVGWSTEAALTYLQPVPWDVWWMYPVPVWRGQA